MTQANNYAPKRGKSGSINIVGEDLDKLQSPVVAFSGQESAGTPVNSQLVKADVPSLPDGVYLLKLKGTVDGQAFEQVLGGYTVGPPVTGLVCDKVYPEMVPPAGMVTIYILGNGFLAEGRAPNPEIKFNEAITRPGKTIGDAIIEVANIPSAREARAPLGVAVAVQATFSDGQSVIGAIIYR